MPYAAWIPLTPPSVNALYNILYHLRRVELKPEVRQFKTQVKLYLPPSSVPTGTPLAVEVSLYALSWHTKEGKVRKLDVHNLLKCFLDAVSEHLGIDDSFFWKVSVEKCDLTGLYPKPGIALSITPYPT